MSDLRSVLALGVCRRHAPKKTIATARAELNEAQRHIDEQERDKLKHLADARHTDERLQLAAQRNAEQVPVEYSHRTLDRMFASNVRSNVRIERSIEYLHQTFDRMFCGRKTRSRCCVAALRR